jgi:hypothetical protein
MSTTKAEPVCNLSLFLTKRTIEKKGSLVRLRKRWRRQKWVGLAMTAMHLRKGKRVLFGGFILAEK